jgi:2-methylaconitate cis-trans-isomerase PrpF
MIMRGGTSKGLFFAEKDLPPPGPERDRMLLRVMGSPDGRQIDGLGGAASVTSKVAIIAPSAAENADVNYTFAQVAVDKAVVDYKGNCGNISSAVGPYAIEAGLVTISEPRTVVRILNTNTNKIIHAEVQVRSGQVLYEGEYRIDGVPGSAAPVKLTFFDPAGSVTGKLLPTGNAVDVLRVPGSGEIEVSIVDAANPLVFARVEDAGLTGLELPAEIDSSEEILRRMEAIRAAAAVKLGFVANAEEAALKSPAVPKMTLVTRAKAYVTTEGRLVKEEEIDLVGRMMSMQKAHRTYALTGALCTAAAAAVEGTLVQGLVSLRLDETSLRIGHPGGVIEAGVETERHPGGTRLISVSAYRTARLLMKGTAYYL